MITRDLIADAPTSPGVYLMKGGEGTVLYVGKARDLRKRVASYFRESGDSRPQIRFLMSRVARIEFLVTDTDKEALLLENTLIKKHRPRYNISLRDDKTYFSLRLDPREEFPRLTIVRKTMRDGARYFGPYSSGSAARQVLKQLQRLFPLRHYPLETCRRRRRPCLFHQLGQCSAPCHDLIGKGEYAALVEGATLFLSGRTKTLVADCHRRMALASSAQRFEEAARYRDLIRSIDITTERQKVVTTGGDADVVGFWLHGGVLEVCILFIRGGAVMDMSSHSLSWELEDDRWLEQFLLDHYRRSPVVPPEIVIPLPLESLAGMEDLLSEMAGRRVRVRVPARGERLRLVEMASKNAEVAAQRRQSQLHESGRVLEELASRLSLSRIPRRIECYDISMLQGDQAVGSGVAFTDGRPDRNRYRRYRIRTVEGADDFASMAEVLNRRFVRGIKEGDLPDLVVLDGGMGQLNAVLSTLGALGVSGVDLVALAKSRIQRNPARNESQRSQERVFLPGRKNPVVMRQNSAPLLLLARIRDEAHRFAVTYHQRLRGKALVSSALDGVPGVGPARLRTLLSAFGSVAGVAGATEEELAAVSGMNRTLARRIREFLAGDAEDGA
jgi:excinuclease ABC subunit C